MTELDGLRWKPKWVTHHGCLKGCLDYLNVDVSDGWLSGASGHAFLINIHEQLCPSGPTAWHMGRMTDLCQNVGCGIRTIQALKSQEDFAAKQELAWTEVRKAIAQKHPCYGWELAIPEFYVIYGHDDVGYYFSGASCDLGKGPLPWQKLADTGIGWLAAFIVTEAEPATPEHTVREALRFALDHATHPEKWTFPKYKTGLGGYDSWTKALTENCASGFGTAYNAAVWAECRAHAVDFLREAKGKLPARLSPLLDDAAARYEDVSRGLATVSETFPFLNVPDDQKEANVKDPGRRQAAAEALRTARDAEEKGLAVLGQILGEL